MNKFKYKDMLYAEYIYNNGFSKKFFNTEIKLLSLYVRDIIGITKKSERKKFLCEFCSKHLIDYNRMKYYKTINSAISYSSNKRNKLITIDSVPIYDCEIDFLQSHRLTNDEEKLLFTLLVIYKLQKKYFEEKNPDKPYNNLYFKGGSSKYSDLKKVSNIPHKCDINSDIILALAVQGYVTPYTRGCIKMNYIEELNYSKANIIFNITNFNNIGYWLEWYRGNKRIEKCKKCGNVFYKKSNRQIFCKECQGYQPIENKTLICIDCGKEMKISGSAKNKRRCDYCQNEHRKAKQKELMRKKRAC